MSNDDLEPITLATNGVHGRTGKYLVDPPELTQLAEAAKTTEEEPGNEELADTRRKAVAAGVMKTVPWVNELDLADAGWGVIFSGAEEDKELVNEMLEQLKPLLEHRKQAAAANDPERYQEYTGKRGYNGQTALGWLAHNGVGTGSADPEDMPVYLLIVGSPDRIPFSFQYGIDMQRAVGRIHFDNIADYRRYAESVVAHETGAAAKKPHKEIALFGPRNPGDVATGLSSSRLLATLADRLPNQPQWSVTAVEPADSSKARLQSLLSEEGTAALLFTASHGIGFDSGDPLQLSDQGALVCQDWGGPGDEVSPEKYLAGADVPADASLQGRMAFLFACYGGGTPTFDDFAHRISPDTRREIASRAFVGALPQKLLAHPNGGMLAVAAHVDRAWSYSFQWGKARTQTRSFEATLRELMAGKPIGLAFDHINVKAGTLAVAQSQLLSNAIADPSQLRRTITTWTAAVDARNYVVIGDPAVRLDV